MNLLLPALGARKDRLHNGEGFRPERTGRRRREPHSAIGPRPDAAAGGACEPFGMSDRTRKRPLDEAERAYLASRPLCRMATVDPSGAPRVDPVRFFLQEDGTILSGGLSLAATERWRNLMSNPKLALVVDDLVSVRPWRVRGVEIRGEAELLTGPHDLAPGMSDELIRVRPHRVHSWGLDGD